MWQGFESYIFVLFILWFVLLFVLMLFKKSSGNGVVSMPINPENVNPYSTSNPNNVDLVEINGTTYTTDLMKAISSQADSNNSNWFNFVINKKGAITIKKLSHNTRCHDDGNHFGPFEINEDGKQICMCCERIVKI